MVVYFSGTGNSKHCAERIAAVLQDQIVDAGGYIKNQIAADLVSGLPWVFVTPTYAWQLPRIFEQFIRSGCFSGNKNAYFVMTCGEDIGNAQQYVRALCEEVGLCYRGIVPVVMPENYIAMFPVPDQKEAEQIIAKAQPTLLHAAELIGQGLDFPDRTPNLQDRAKSGKINQIFYRKYVKADDFYVKETCVGCGLCAERCVCNNITMVDGKPVWDKNCTHCMACICGCPAEAIEYGKKSIGKPRYWCK